MQIAMTRDLRSKGTESLRRLLSLAAMLAVAAPLAPAQTTTWTPDPAHTEVDFSVLHMSLTKVHGRFGQVTGVVHYDAADIAKSSVQMTIDVTGVDTGVAMRDNDLKSANFFDVAKYPTATFTSTSVARDGEGLTIAGNLTVRGITKPVTLRVEKPIGPVKGMGNKQHLGFSATTTVDRTAFDLGMKYPSAAIGDAIQLTIEMDAVEQP
jgi:polyisoprenoid-binding protein YceI